MPIGDHTRGPGCKRSDTRPIPDSCSPGGELIRAVRSTFQLLCEPQLGLRFGCASILTSSGAALAIFPARQASDHPDNIQKYSAELSRGAPKFQADRSSRATAESPEPIGPSIHPILAWDCDKRPPAAHTAQVQQLLSLPKRKGSAVDFHHGGSRARPRMLDSDEGGVASGHIIGV